MELGIYTFGDIVADPHTGKKPTSTERTRQLMDMASRCPGTLPALANSRCTLRTDTPQAAIR